MKAERGCGNVLEPMSGRRPGRSEAVMTFAETIDKIFQSYDVRGIYPDEYDGEIAYLLGRGAVAYSGARRVLAGRDMRRGGETILSALARGAMDQGADVTDAGMCSTDALTYSSRAGGFDLALMVTASHNPAEYNGTKLVRRDGTSIGRNAGLGEVQKLVLSRDFPGAARRGTFRRAEILPGFIEHALSFIDRGKLKPFKIVVDAGNGMGSVLVQLLAKHVPFRIVPMFFELDGSFPNHDPEPTRPKCVELLRARVLEERADLGIGFDGDADRAAFVDETGGFINGSELASIISRRVLAAEPGSAVGYCLVSSWIARDAIVESGGRAVITAVGGPNIRPVMKQEKLSFASERSGHFYLRANNCDDSGLIAALIVLEKLSETGGTLSDLVRPYKRYHLAEENLLVGTDKSTKAELDGIKAAKLARIPEVGEGARRITRGDDRYEFDDWWFCVRASGTEPRKLRVTVEATSSEVRDEKFKAITGLVAD